ncbi:MAG: glycosyltransferase N-terminal domain-containing protein [Bryobacteraceae bacterium]|jgi:hypothetical protein
MEFWEKFRYLLERAGLSIPCCRRSLWVHGDTPLQFDAARPLIQAIMAERPHVRLVLTSGRHGTLRFLRRTFTDEQTLHVPFDAAFVVRRFLCRLQVRHILLLDGGRSVPSQAIRLAVLEQIPVSAVNVGNPKALNTALLTAARLCVHDELVAQQLCEMGVPAENIAVTGCLDLDPSRRAHWPSNAAVRRSLHLSVDVPVVVAVDVPREEERLILDAFAEARRVRPGVRLLLEPRESKQIAGLEKEIARRGWKRDVLLVTSPGSLFSFLPVAGASQPSPSMRTYDAISATLPTNPELPIVAQDWRVPTLRDKGGSSRAWHLVAPALMRRRIDSWEDLGARLGHPRSVLCLGNGPSSEDARVNGFAHDCLMRVNWRWKLRGFLADPQIVFVGDPVTVHIVKHAIFGLWNTPLEYGMLLRHLITRGPVPMKYFTMERISTIVRDQTWPARPTNGALMIAAGAALAPERLIIAGVDLYLHPDGRYPGDLLGNNQYARAHSRDTDLAIIRDALAQYRGELIILSDTLRSALENPCEVFRAGC